MRFSNGTGAAEEVDGFDLLLTLIEWYHQVLLTARSMIDEQLLREAIVLVRRCYTWFQ